MKNQIKITFVRGFKSLVYASATIRGIEITMSSSDNLNPYFDKKLLKITDVMHRICALNKDFGPFEIIRGY
jgi:hypothetical protein